MATFFPEGVSRYPKVVEHNSDLENALIPITEVEKVELVKDILASEKFMHRADKSRAVLQFLFERHLRDPDAPPTRSDIFTAIWNNPDHTDPNATVGNAVKRIRTALHEYFTGPGALQLLRLSIPTGGHALAFSRVLESEQEVINWFWGTYLTEGECRFGIIPPAHSRYPRFEHLPKSLSLEPFRTPWPDGTQSGYVYPVLRIYQCFERLMATRGGQSFDLLEPEWDRVQGGHLNRYHTIWLDRAVTRSSDFVVHVTVSDPKRIRHPVDMNALDSDYFPACMYRDPANNAAILIRGPKDEPLHHFNDSSTARYVLVTRATLPRSNRQVTRFSAYEHPAILPVARFVTSALGLRIIASRKEFVEGTKELRKASLQSEDQATTSQLTGAPLNFQIVFSCPSDYDARRSIGETIDQIQIVYCVIAENLELVEWPRVKEGGGTAL